MSETMSDWRPIDDAPKDGTRLILWGPAWEDTWGVQTGYWSDGKWETAEGAVGEDEWEDDGDYDDADLASDDGPLTLGPTHWMPLPAPPALAEKA